METAKRAPTVPHVEPWIVRDLVSMKGEETMKHQPRVVYARMHSREWARVLGFYFYPHDEFFLAPAAATTGKEE